MLQTNSLANDGLNNFFQPSLECFWGMSNFFGALAVTRIATPPSEGNLRRRCNPSWRPCGFDGGSKRVILYWRKERPRGCRQLHWCAVQAGDDWWRAEQRTDDQFNRILCGNLN